MVVLSSSLATATLSQQVRLGLRAPLGQREQWLERRQGPSPPPSTWPFSLPATQGHTNRRAHTPTQAPLCRLNIKYFLQGTYQRNLF